MLVKCALVPYITCVNIAIEGQIWVELSCCPGMKLGGVYIPPVDSPYHDPALLGALEGQVTDCDRAIVMGDFNARVGCPPSRNINGKRCEYNGVKDLTSNYMGRVIANMCEEKEMVVANHLKYDGKQLGGNLSFRRGDRWISEIDLCLVKYSSLNVLKDLCIRQEIMCSDHAPLTVTINNDILKSVTPSQLLERASNLGRTFTHSPRTTSVPRGPHHDRVNMGAFIARMAQCEPPVLGVVSEDSVQEVVQESCNEVNRIAKECKKTNVAREGSTDLRWKIIMEENDSGKIWRAINWKGEVGPDQSTTQPTDSQFKTHFEELLNPVSDEDGEPNFEQAPNIPILDDPFTFREMETALRNMKKKKSFVGISPALLTNLPMNWLMFFLTLFNVIFDSFCFPLTWCYSKLTVLFKSGDRMSCDNYRGISVMDTLAKLYDTLIMNRIKMWMDVDNCQAGAMEGRGCLEQIFALRLLCDYVNYKKCKLYVLFIDYRKAYDKVPRSKLIECLKSAGCGRRMLKAIYVMYRCTRNVLKSATVEASVGVRQGAPSSCLLFVIYINQMIRMLKAKIATDGFLGALHALLLMDDTVILATSRDMCIRKFKVVVEYCKDYGMVINEDKTKFFVINNADCDKVPLSIEGHIIKYCDRYKYLGAWFTDSGRMKDVMSLHEMKSQSVVNKFSIFCASNPDMPYCYKRRVFDAAVLAELTYSCESWLTNNCVSLTSQYSKLMKCLLGVRNNTSSNLCHIESGIKPVYHVVSVRRKRFLERKLASLDRNEPFHIIFDLCREAETPGFKFIQSAIQYDDNINPLDKIINLVTNKPEDATKYQTYKSVLNSSLGVHKIYSEDIYIPDYIRVAFTRIRVMSHNLKIETGRWSRTPRDLRVCPCDGQTTQTEQHVLLECTLTRQTRQKYDMVNKQNLDVLFNETQDVNTLCRYVYEVLSIYKT